MSNKSPSMRFIISLFLLLGWCTLSIAQDIEQKSKPWELGINVLNINRIQRNNSNLGYSNQVSYLNGIMAKKELKVNFLRIGFDFFTTTYNYTSSQYGIVNYEKIYFREQGQGKSFDLRLGLEHRYHLGKFTPAVGLDLSFIRAQIDGEFNGMPLPSKRMQSFNAKSNGIGLLPNLSMTYGITRNLLISLETNAVIMYSCKADSRYPSNRYGKCIGAWRTAFNPIRGTLITWRF